MDHPGKDSARHDSQDRLVVELHHLGFQPLARVGGKALNLGKIAAAGLPVPAGFCLTTSAYRSAVPAEVGVLAARLESLDPGDAEHLSRLALEARDLVNAAPMPPEVDAAVRTAYAAMGTAGREQGKGGGPAVAVRSSATAEDLPFASFAGQQDTFVDVTGADGVLDAVRRCWASLWSDRAVVYRAANGISQREVSLAVVVQDFVEAAAAGVLFTANPVTGTRGETVIDAHRGAGQDVVSGAVNPDHFQIHTASGRLVAGTHHDGIQHDGGAHRPVLDAQQLRELISLGTAAQRLLGAPQDVEWVIDRSGTVWLTQSRPVTTLYPLPVPLPVPLQAGSPAAGFMPGSEDYAETPAGEETRVYLCGSLLQGLTRPITPMGLTALNLMRGDQGPWRQYATPGLRLYVDLTPAFHSKRGRQTLLKAIPLADGRSAALLPALMEDPRFTVRKERHAGNRNQQPKGQRKRSARGVRNFATTAMMLPAMVRAVVRPEAELRRAHAYGKRLQAGVASNAAAATSEQRLEYVEGAMHGTVEELIGATLPAPAAGYLLLAAARRLLRGIVEPRELEAVLRGLPHNVTTEMDLELWRLAASLGRHPDSRAAFLGKSPEDLARDYSAGTLPAPAQNAIRGFLGKYGHRAVGEIDLGMPRWSDHPDHVLGMIANYLRVEDPEQAPDRQFARAAEQAEAAMRRMVGKARAKGRLRSRLVGFCLHRTRQLAGLRELPKFNIVVILGEMHRQLAEVGKDLAGTQRIAAPEDVFFLTFDELRVGLRGADLSGIVGSRRRQYDLELRRRHIPRLLLSDGTDVEAALAPTAEPPSEGVLTGTPASAGTATGRVRVILDPVGAHLEPGEILVAPSTDPGWTPLFLTAGALVMEMGGVISHGAVVAREYGIPAVVGVPDATTRLHTGAAVTVDGAAGTISLSEKLDVLQPSRGEDPGTWGR
ncbi:pyruvate,water dikinase [Arthrobacter pascens]|uniref:PEP/pyruvate-binding domain-containing protein n=1 Tax=Arthrobacter pascens TaxID=1677 RepID=UPI00285F923E|nr:PEP/pyruvate-binding domain-containing protein [Arthrobacter pascens]MDR6559373.1 pyruvate,water dikinase [Arthrobacter pascens]